MFCTQTRTRPCPPGTSHISLFCVYLGQLVTAADRDRYDALADAKIAELVRTC